jgi:alkaline phosphatase
MMVKYAFMQKVNLIRRAFSNWQRNREKQRGKATGLVVTSTITHATPAAFGAHVQKSACEYEIGRQYIMETQPDVLLISIKS